MSPFPHAFQSPRAFAFIFSLLVFLGCASFSSAQSPDQSSIQPNENGIIRILAGGTPESPRIIDGGGQTVRGIDLRGQGRETPPASNLIVRNFVVRSDSNDRAGVWIAGRRQDNIVIENVDIQGFQIGIWSMGVTNLIVRDSNVSECQMGLSIGATGALVENCNVSNLVHRGMGDSDYIRFAGENITFRGNRLWGANVAALSRQGSHVDGFQVFTNDSLPRKNIVIEENIVMDFHQAIIAQDRKSSPSEFISGWTIRNNIFAHGHAWSLLFENIDDITIENNLFYDIKPKGAGVRFGSRVVSYKQNVHVKMTSGIWVDAASTVRGAEDNIYKGVSRERRGSAFGVGDPLIVEGPRGTFRLAPDSPLHETTHGPNILRRSASSSNAPPIAMEVDRSSQPAPRERVLETNDDPNRPRHAAGSSGRDRTGDRAASQHGQSQSAQSDRERTRVLRPREKALKNIRDAQESLNTLIEQAQEARNSETSEASQASLDAAIAEAANALESLERAENAIGGR